MKIESQIISRTICFIGHQSLESLMIVYIVKITNRTSRLYFNFMREIILLSMFISVHKVKNIMALSDVVIT